MKFACEHTALWAGNRQQAHSSSDSAQYCPDHFESPCVRAANQFVYGRQTLPYRIR
jgi:hypothetical protein